jgi:hypothetical protein
MTLLDWIEGWHRRHSSIGRLSPNNFESRLLAARAPKARACCTWDPVFRVAKKVRCADPR